jgi:hypothetical protein
MIISDYAYRNRKKGKPDKKEEMESKPNGRKVWAKFQDRESAFLHRIKTTICLPTVDSECTVYLRC